MSIDPLDHLGLAAQIAQRFHAAYGGDLDDWKQDAYLSLHRACELFDASKGCRFSTYAHRCISGQLTLRKNELQGRKCLGGVGKRHWVTLKPQSLSGIGQNIDIPVVQANAAESRPPWWNDLTERQQQVVRLRAAGQTLVAVSGALGICRERVRQIEIECQEAVLRSLQQSRERADRRRREWRGRKRQAVPL